MNTLADRLIAGMRKFSESTDPNRVMGLSQEHAKALLARLTPPAEVVRYTPEIDGILEPKPDPEGEWVRYEDHAAAVLALRLELYGANCKVDEATEALAASEAKRKEVEDAMRRVTESLESAKASTTNDQYHGHVRQARSIARADLDQPKTEDAA